MAPFSREPLEAITKLFNTAANAATNSGTVPKSYEALLEPQFNEREAQENEMNGATDPLRYLQNLLKPSAVIGSTCMCLQAL